MPPKIELSVEDIATNLKERFDAVVMSQSSIDKIVLCAFANDAPEYFKILRIVSENNPLRSVDELVLEKVILAERDKYLCDPGDFLNTFATGSHTFSVDPVEPGLVLVFASALRDATMFADSVRKHSRAFRGDLKQLTESL
jgi:hypothetical protein